MNSAIFNIRILIAGITAFIITWLSCFFVIPLLRKMKAEQHVRNDGPKSHLIKEGTPTMGGMMIALGLFGATFAVSSYKDSHAVYMTGFLVISTFLFMLIGLCDDGIKLLKKQSLGLRVWQKIVLELIVSVFCACYSYYLLKDNSLMVPFVVDYINLGTLYVPFTIFVYLAMVNSVNLTDGLDGLASSVTLINAVTCLIISLVVISWLPNDNKSVLLTGLNMNIFLSAIIGALAAFLCFNRYPAKVFMGDTGSFMLGAALTSAATALSIQLLLPIMGFMFVMSAVSVIIQVTSYKLRKKRVFKMAPLHHHFELCGIKETRVVAGYVAVTCVLSAVALLGVLL